MKDIREVLTSEKKNFLHPFVWLNDCNTYEEIKAQFQSLKEMGIYSATLQYEEKSGTSKEKFKGLMELSEFNEGYFSMIEKMVAVCKELGMTFWVQDAAPFPTGAANGWFLREGYYDKGKVYLTARHTDLRGPIRNATILLDNYYQMVRGDFSKIADLLYPQGPSAFRKDELFHAIAMKKQETPDGKLKFDDRTAIDLTGYVNHKDNILQFDLEDGDWRVFFIFRTRQGGRKFFMNLLDRESVQVLIDSVYELHYERLKEEIGRTWQGFFYDETEIGNADNQYDFHCLPGYRAHQMPVTLPWSNEMPVHFGERFGPRHELLLPCLWYDCGEMTRIVHYHFMDIVTRLVRQNYNGQILPWCRERGIKYIGHVLEDENSHTRLGCGAGHYFRVQKHQDMSGIDLVGGQLLPGIDSIGSSWYGGIEGDGEFYHYGIAKLASSEAHINPDKKGQSFCEVNAVYGRISNAKVLKFLLDHLFVSGISNLIPVITGDLRKEHGKLLFDYSNRMCMVLNGSRHVAPVAVLYHAESEWAGRAQFFQRPAKILATNQIDYDVIPGDALIEKDDYMTEILQGQLKVGMGNYRAVVIPYCKYIRKDVLKVLGEAAGSGVSVYFVDGLPVGYCEESCKIDWAGYQMKAVKLSELASELKREGIMDISCSTKEHFLRYCHVIRDGYDYYMLFNGEPRKTIKTRITFPMNRQVRMYDVMNEKRLPVECSYEEGKVCVPVTLGQYESKLLVFGDFGPCNVRRGRKESECIKWTVTLHPGTAEEQVIALDGLVDLGTSDKLPRYAGEIVYRTDVLLSGKLPSALNLGMVCDSAVVRLNGQNLGCRIASPYEFDVRDIVREGENELIIEVSPNPARGMVQEKDRDLFYRLSAVTYAAMEPVGLLGPVKFLWME